MAPIPGSVRVTGFIAPTDTSDTYPVIDPLYGIDGWRSVAGATARNAIPDARRRSGMVVFQQDTRATWVLKDGPWTGTDSDWEAFGGTGTVTSVDLSVPNIFSLTGNPITTAGTIGITLVTQSANLIFAGPSTGVDATPTFRGLVPLDLGATPASGQILQATAGTTMAWNTLSGDATITNAGVLILASTIVAAGPTGSSSVVPVITYDAKGRLTTVTTASITPAAIGAVPTGAVTTSDLTMTTARLLGRTTAATGAIEEITVGTGLSLSGGTLIATVTGTVTGSGTTNQVMYWSSSTAAAGDTGLTYDPSADTLSIGTAILLGAGTAGAPSHSFTSDSDTGVYSVSANDLGFSTGGTLRFDISTTAVTSTLIGVFPAAAAGGTGFASIRLPHGAAPTTNITDGDMWTTTTGVFARINGATVGPFGAASAGGSNTQIQYNNSGAFGGISSFTYDSTDNRISFIRASNSSALSTFQTTNINTSTSGSRQTLLTSITANPASASTGIFAAHDLTAQSGAAGQAIGQLLGVNVNTLNLNSSTVGSLIGVASFVRSGGASVVSTNIYGFQSSLQVDASGSVTNAYGLYLSTSYSGTVTNKWGIYQATATDANYFAGSVTIDGILAGFLADVVIVSGTTLTLSSAHQGRIIRFTSTTAVTVTMPNSLSTGFSCTMYQDGAGTVTVAAGSGATLHNRSTQFGSAGQYGALTLAVVSNAGSAAVGILAGDTA